MFPARAGMNRLTPTPNVETGHVPRPRGDEPVAQLPADVREECSPPARG